MGIQRWTDFQAQPLLRYHASIAAESINNEDDRGSLYAQLGYHLKGSSTRFQFFQFNGSFTQLVRPFEFHNLSLGLGFKQRLGQGDGQSMRYYYFGGLRGDYTFSDNLDELAGDDPFLQLFYPQSAFVRRFIFGASVGGGMEFPFSDLLGFQVNFSINPDFSNQYNQPPIPNVIDPNNPGQNIRLNERQIRNVTFEISLGVRLLRKVVYEEE